MASKSEYAQLSTRVYLRTPVNTMPRPFGWEEISRTGNASASGFSAGVYRKGGEIVIAYTGTNEKQVVDFLLANFPAGISLPTSQVTEAMLLYLETRRKQQRGQVLQYSNC